ncbi:MAG: sulfatase-like hydrolase/transferase [Planctomycetes bacterium]|nr:sulfatase-like hydrolase/transferase [Planctomycetota bacterium]
MHYFDPHLPLEPPPPYDMLYEADALLDAHLAELQVADFVATGQCNKSSEARAVFNLYDGEVSYVDQEVGRLLQELRDLGVWEKSIIIFTADHGEGLNQHNWPVHGRNHNEQLHVPLLMRFPGPRTDLPPRFRQVVSLVDVLPTVLGQIEAPLARGFLEQASGVDVLSPRFRPRPVFSQRTGRDCDDLPGPLFSLTTRQWKYLYQPEVENQLFDRLADPYELENVLSTNAVVGDELHQQLRALLAEQSARGEVFGPQRARTADELDSERLRQLEMLGYVDLSATSHPAQTSQPGTQERGGRE